MSNGYGDESSTGVNCWCGWMDFGFPSVSIILSNPSATVEAVDGGSCEAAEEKPVVAAATVVAEVDHHQRLKRLRSAGQHSQKGMVSNSGLGG